MKTFFVSIFIFGFCNFVHADPEVITGKVHFSVFECVLVSSYCYGDGFIVSEDIPVVFTLDQCHTVNGATYCAGEWKQEYLVKEQKFVPEFRITKVTSAAGAVVYHLDWNANYTSVERVTVKKVFNIDSFDPKYPVETIKEVGRVTTYSPSVYIVFN